VALGGEEWPARR